MHFLCLIIHVGVGLFIRLYSYLYAPFSLILSVLLLKNSVSFLLFLSLSLSLLIYGLSQQSRARPGAAHPQRTPLLQTPHAISTPRYSPHTLFFPVYISSLVNY